ncbi:MAG TPA: tetratricopeptide repeat protein [Bacteroidia bacterium]
MFDDFEDNDPANDDFFNQENIEESLIKFEQLKTNQSVFFSEEEIENLSYHFFLSGQINEQLQIVEHGLYLYPNKVDFLVEKASIFSMKNDFQNALEIVRLAKAIEPYNAIVLKMEGEILTDLDKTDEAEESFRQALGFSEYEDDEFIIDIYVNYAQLLSQNNGLDKANRLIEKALRTYPKNDQLYNQLAMNFIANGHYDKAIDYFKNKIDNDPYSHNCWFHLGRFYELTGNQELALNAYEYAGLANKNAKNAFFSLGGIYETKGEYEKAIDNYRQCFKNEGDLYPYICIARCYLALENGEMARSFLIKAKSLEQILPEYNYLIGYSHLTDKRPLTALPYFKKVFLEDSEDFTALKGIFTCYCELDDVDAVRDLYLEQLENNYEIIITNWKEMASVLYINELDDELNAFLAEVRSNRSYDDELDGVLICIRFDQHPSDSNKDSIISRLIQEFDDTMESVKLFCTDLYEDTEFKKLVNYYQSNHEQ